MPLPRFITFFLVFLCFFSQLSHEITNSHVHNHGMKDIINIITTAISIIIFLGSFGANQQRGPNMLQQLGGLLHNATLFNTFSLVKHAARFLLLIWPEWIPENVNVWYGIYIIHHILWTNNCILYFQSGRRTLHATFFKRINLEMENDRLTRFAILQFEWILVVALWWMIANYENNDTDHCVFSGFVIYSIYQPLCSVLFYLPYCIIRYRCGNISSSL